MRTVRVLAIVIAVLASIWAAAVSQSIETIYSALLLIVISVVIHDLILVSNLALNLRELGRFNRLSFSEGALTSLGQRATRALGLEPPRNLELDTNEQLGRSSSLDESQGQLELAARSAAQLGSADSFSSLCAALCTLTSGDAAALLLEQSGENRLTIQGSFKLGSEGESVVEHWCLLALGICSSDNGTKQRYFLEAVPRNQTKMRQSLVMPLVWDDGAQKHLGAIWVGFKGRAAPAASACVRAVNARDTIAGELSRIYTISHLNREASEARESDLEKQQFLSHFSHDLRSPLNNINAILTLLQLDEPSEEKRELIEVAQRNCSDVNDMISGILDFTRHRAGKLVSQPCSVQVFELLEELCLSFRITAKERRLDLILDCPNKEVYVWVDRLQTKRALANLISNALKYTNSGSVTVRCHAARENKHLSIEVSDTGPGLSEAQLKCIFVPFKRFASREDGIGLGLSVAKLLTEAQNGTISARSIKDRGTTFSITLPASASIPEHPGAPTNCDSLKSAISVLLVDDDPDFLSTTARGLKGLQFEVITAQREIDAIGMLTFGDPDIVVCDLNMPDGGFGEITKHLQVNKLDMPLILLSGSADRAQLENYGDTARVLSKPIQIDDLALAIKETLAPEAENGDASKQLNREQQLEAIVNQ